MHKGKGTAPPRESRALRVFLIIWIPFSLVILALIGWTAYELRGLFPYAKHIVDSSPMPSRSMEPVEILFQSFHGLGTRLSIPAAYMHWSDDRKPGLHWNIAFLLAYPDMAPYALLNAQARENLQRAGGTGGELRYDLLGHITVANPDFVAQQLQDKITSKYTTLPGEEDGFLVYREKLGGGLYDYLIPKSTPNSPTRYLQCGAMTDEHLAKTKWRPGCSMHVQFSDRLAFDYHLPRAAIAEWSEIDRRMVELVRGFVVDCFEGAKLKPSDPLPATHPCEDNFRGVE
jgi:hypothetical protein